MLAKMVERLFIFKSFENKVIEKCFSGQDFYLFTFYLTFRYMYSPYSPKILSGSKKIKNTCLKVQSAFDIVKYIFLLQRCCIKLLYVLVSYPTARKNNNVFEKINMITKYITDRQSKIPFRIRTIIKYIFNCKTPSNIIIITNS